MEQASLAPDPRYPAGRFKKPETITAEDRDRFIGEIERLPGQIRAALAGLNEQQLDTPYREGGWTVRQVAHHLAESHMNSFIRFKLALTEDNPAIKPYDEAACAETADAKSMPVAPSLALLDGLHQRWTVLLRSLSEEQYRRTFRHPESGLMRLDVTLALYAWHCRHHTRHITALRERMGWV
jgi:uncharacterized damage-inducible protein DinB